MATNQYINFYSHNPVAMNTAIQYNLVHKAGLHLHFSFHHKNLDFIKYALMKNNYPIRFIEKHMKKRLCDIFDDRNSANISDNSEKNSFIVLPYVKSLNPELKSILNKHNIKLTNIINNKFNNLIFWII